MGVEGSSLPVLCSLSMFVPYLWCLLLLLFVCFKGSEVFGCSGGFGWGFPFLGDLLWCGFASLVGYCSSSGSLFPFSLPSDHVCHGFDLTIFIALKPGHPVRKIGVGWNDDAKHSLELDLEMCEFFGKLEGVPAAKFSHQDCSFMFVSVLFP